MLIPGGGSLFFTLIPMNSFGAVTVWEKGPCSHI